MNKYKFIYNLNKSRVRGGIIQINAVYIEAIYIYWKSERKSKVLILTGSHDTC